MKANIVDFHDFLLPLSYGSELQEHKCVRSNVGLFDVSHMQVIDVTGDDAKAFLLFMLSNDIAKVVVGQAQYSLLLNANAGVIDDLVVYCLSDSFYRIVANSATRDKVLPFLLSKKSDYKVAIKARNDLAIIALQGPKYLESLSVALNDNALIHKIQQLKRFRFICSDDVLYSTTGYTGEAGIEVIANYDAIISLTKLLLSANVQLCGLAARDILRLEAGFNLSNQDMDESVFPFQANLSWVVKELSHDFIGKENYILNKKSNQYKLIGIKGDVKGGLLRAKQKVFLSDIEVGVITSAGFSPMLNATIAFARVKLPDNYNGKLSVVLRNLVKEVDIVSLPFYRPF